MVRRTQGLSTLEPPDGRNALQTRELLKCPTVPFEIPPRSVRTAARKLKPIETGHIFAAVLAALLNEVWTTSKIAELLVR